jgi:hypothetical protein
MVRVFVRIVVLGILSIPVTLLVWWGISPFVNYETIGGSVARLAFYNQAPGGPLLRGLEVVAVVDLLVSFGFLSGIWFLWKRGRKERRQIHNPKQWGDWLRRASTFLVATTCALPVSYYAVLVKSKFHSGLAETPSELMQSYVLIVIACAIALCGIALLGRVWPNPKH